MNNLRRIGNSISICIPPDEDGFTGRECPEPSCEGYFKIEFGTGLKGEGLPCHCPYCGHTVGHDHFWTKAQIEYAKSSALRKITDAVHKDLKNLDFDHKPRGGFGIGISMKVKPGRPTPIHYYREKVLETEVVCTNCTLRYSVYGVFAFCPDCGQHNSMQILDANLEVVAKMLDLAAGADKALAEKLIENAMEDCVSAFDGFGRELCRLRVSEAADSARAGRISFQNLDGAKTNVINGFGHDISGHVTPDEWTLAVRNFQKRHLIAHRMGVVDESYVAKSGDVRAVVGRKVSVSAEDVRSTLVVVRKLAQGFSAYLAEAHTAGRADT